MDKTKMPKLTPNQVIKVVIDGTSEVLDKAESMPRDSKQQRLRTYGAFSKHIRSRVEHEDELINHRLSWLIASQAIFFATHGLLLTAAKPVNSRMLPFVATITCLLIGGSIWDAALATHRLAKKAKDRREEYNLTEDDVRELAKPVGETGLQIFALLVPYGVPLVFLVAWVLILLRVFEI